MLFPDFSLILEVITATAQHGLIWIKKPKKGLFMKPAWLSLLFSFKPIDGAPVALCAHAHTLALTHMHAHAHVSSNQEAISW